MKPKYTLPMDARKLASKPPLLLRCAVFSERYLKISETRGMVTFQINVGGKAQDVHLEESLARLLQARLNELFPPKAE